MEDPTAEEYKSADITIDDQALENIGFRTKGNSSLTSVASSDSDRYSYRIKTDKYVENQTTKEGVTNFVLNNMYSDPTYMREYMAYKILEDSGLKVPDCKYIKVSINGEYKGLYLLVENIEKPFLKNNFGDDSGNLYKADERSTLITGSESNLELKSGEDEDKEGLINLINILNDENTTKENIEEVMDVESFLRNIAFNTVFGSYDSYNGNLAHNYYLYELAGKIYMIPWDYNMSFAAFSQGGDTLITEVPIDEPLYGTDLESRPLVNKLLGFKEYKKEYINYIEEYNDYLNKVPNMIDKLDEFIGEEIKGDPTSFYDYEDYDKSITYDEGYEFTIMESKGNIGGEQKPGIPEGEEVPEIPEGEEVPVMPEYGEVPVMPEGGEPPFVRGGQEGEEGQGDSSKMGEDMIQSNVPPILNYTEDRYKFVLKELESMN